MIPDSIPRAKLSIPIAFVIGCFAALITGCTTPSRITFVAERYQIGLQLDPPNGGLMGMATLDLSALPGNVSEHEGPVYFELALHPDLQVTAVSAAGATVRKWSSVKASSSIEDRNHRITLDHSVNALSLQIQYGGTLSRSSDAASTGSIDPAPALPCTIEPEGIFLTNGRWYPRPATSEGTRPPADFVVIVDPIPGIEVVATGARDLELEHQTGRWAWRSHYTIPEMTLIGGVYDTKRVAHGSTAIQVVIPQNRNNNNLADGLIERTKMLLDRHRSVLGSLPFRELSLVKTDSPDCLSLPAIVLVGDSVNASYDGDMDYRDFDRALLQSWIGKTADYNSQRVDWRDGLIAYLTEITGQLETEGRRVRRNACHSLTRRHEKSVRFSATSPADAITAHDKMIFHMLSRQMGEGAFAQAMGSLIHENRFRNTSLDDSDLQDISARINGSTLEAFFRPSPPFLRIDGASWTSEDQILRLVLLQEHAAFDWTVPIRVTTISGASDFEVPSTNERTDVALPMLEQPLSVELDPDYHLLRRVPMGEVVPTLQSTHSGDSLVTVVSERELGGAFQSIRALVESSIPESKRTVFVAGSSPKPSFAHSSVLILGQAVRDPYISAFLSAIEFPVRWTDQGFLIEGERYEDSENSIVCTVTNPDSPRNAITVVFSNHDTPLPDHLAELGGEWSLVVFRRSIPVMKRDFEPLTSIPVR